MQQILSYMRRAVEEYDMISPGDHLLVGVSGGKDSVVLLAGLARLRSFLGIDFRLSALTLDMGFGGVPGDFSPLEALCRELEVPYTVKRTDLGPLIFDVRQEKSPCSLCSRMRRGAIHTAANELGCNKVALGHHADDAVETFMMNLFNEGRVGCFAPVTYLSRSDLTLIRPMVFAWEKDVVHARHTAGLPLLPSGCPADKNTNRQWTKDFLKNLEQQNPGIRKRILGALCRGDVGGWGLSRPNEPEPPRPE